MGIEVGDLRPGKCFLSQGAKPQVVRVIGVRDGLVRFEARANRRTWSGRTDVSVPEFMAGLVREVGSDFTPGAEPRHHF